MELAEKQEAWAQAWQAEDVAQGDTFQAKFLALEWECLQFLCKQIAVECWAEDSEDNNHHMGSIMGITADTIRVLWDRILLQALFKIRFYLYEEQINNIFKSFYTISKEFSTVFQIFQLLSYPPGSTTTMETQDGSPLCPSSDQAQWKRNGDWL